MYPPELVAPMRADLDNVGFEEAMTPDAVDAAVNTPGTVLMVLNSVCGCAAGTCRPGVLMAVQNATNRPDRLTTSFAGFDIEAVNEVRKLSLPYPPSSPAIALFKNGQLVNMVERHQIEGRPAQVIAQHLISIFDEHCN